VSTLKLSVTQNDPLVADILFTTNSNTFKIPLTIRLSIVKVLVYASNFQPYPVIPDINWLDPILPSVTISPVPTFIAILESLNVAVLLKSVLF